MSNGSKLWESQKGANSERKAEVRRSLDKGERLVMWEECR
jgi:hypothetical protein